MAVDYSGVVRARDPETSWEAASRQTRAKVDLVKVVILSLLAEHGPMTDERLVDHFDAYCFHHAGVPHVTAQSVRTRRKSLELEGRVRDSGRRASTRSGSTGTVWMVVP